MPGGVLRALARFMAIIHGFAIIAAEDVVDGVFLPQGAAKLRRRIVRRATRVMPGVVDAGIDASGNVERADTVAAVNASGSKRFGVARFADMVADTVDGISLSQSGNASWIELKGKKTFQAYTSHGGASSRAVDGSSKNGWFENSCAGGAGSQTAFWEIDLEKNYSITHISLLREDKNIQNISPFSVIVDGKRCIDNERFQASLFQQHFRCEAVGRHVRLSRPTATRIFAICEVQLRVKTWRTISSTRICEGFFSRGRAQQQIEKHLDMPDCSLEGCQTCCQREIECRSIDWFPATCICQLYRSACPANQTTHGHNEGSSYELEFES
eukprot:TRINITY_DN14352_c0_g6_i1.p1 TRINITY_DN14352_c0_g6~~TRINITY_DN14352_c0_g6_i1.p1  ORF type:complete len:327 (-),score=38.07 TRINITY_DN14352_c0_g6_i1:18-998(-)